MTKTTVEESLIVELRDIQSPDWFSLRRWSGEITWTLSVGDEVISALAFAVEQDAGYAYSARLVYAVPGVGDIDLGITIDTTSPGFGGQAWWFICPLEDCGRRCRKLYLPPGAKYFGCRGCHNLTYRSCLDSRRRAA